MPWMQPDRFDRPSGSYQAQSRIQVVFIGLCASVGVTDAAPLSGKSFVFQVSSANGCMLFGLSTMSNYMNNKLCRLKISAVEAFGWNSSIAFEPVNRDDQYRPLASTL